MMSPGWVGLPPEALNDASACTVRDADGRDVRVEKLWEIVRSGEGYRVVKRSVAKDGKLVDVRYEAHRAASPAFIVYPTLDQAVESVK